MKAWLPIMPAVFFDSFVVDTLAENSPDLWKNLKTYHFSSSFNLQVRHADPYHHLQLSHPLADCRQGGFCDRSDLTSCR